MKNVLNYLVNTAALYPDKKAAALEDHSYTFAELKSYAARLGYRLLASGYKQRPAGVFAARDADTIVYFMAALFGECFYVPIDPDLPQEKMRSEIEDSGMQVMFGKPELKEKAFQAGFAGEYLTLDDMAAEEAPLPAAGDDDPVYMVYTSGSTGKPKGVLKSHKAMISFLDTYCEKFRFTADEVIGNQTPFFFDASAKDIYLMLGTGATMEIIPTMRFALPTELMIFMNEKKITFASWVPSAISLVAQLSPFSMIKPEYLKRLFFVGEVMPMKHLNKWRAAMPDLRCVNLYGSSETAGIICCFEVEGEFADTDVLPIGKPLSNTRIYLMDGDKIIKEPGEIGEIYAVSDALALEYYHDPEKTAASFMVKDFGEGPLRCFKTGDLASYDDNGNLMFASRNDFQIKHMGHRIELGEIEAVALSLPEILRSCCVYDAKKKKIILYCELTEGSTLTGQEIKSKLRSMLTAYMLPGKVIAGPIPLNANGKINRQALQPK